MNFPAWARNVIAAFIYGAVNVLAVVIVDPVAFNFGEQWKKTSIMALVGGILGAADYLKKLLAPIVVASNPNQSNSEKQ